MLNHFERIIFQQYKHDTEEARIIADAEARGLDLALLLDRRVKQVKLKNTRGEMAAILMK